MTDRKQILRNIFLRKGADHWSLRKVCECGGGACGGGEGGCDNLNKRVVSNVKMIFSFPTFCENKYL